MIFFKVVDRVAVLAAGDVDDVDEQAAAVDMAQEVMAKSDAVSRTLDDAGDISHDERHAVGDVDHAEVRIERGEVIICNFRVCVGRDGQERRFTDVREADKADIGKQLQLQNDVVLFPGRPALAKRGT